MLRTFWFSDRNRNLFSKEFASFEAAEDYADRNGLQYYHPNNYPTEEAARQRMELYGDTKYTVFTVPHLYCKACKHFGANCKRVDHKTVKFHKPVFHSYHEGEFSIPCHEFEPAHPEYADYADQWQGIDDAWPVYLDAWLEKGRNPRYATFHLGEDFDTDYMVPFDLFFYGGMIEDGVLKAEYKVTTVRDKVDLGVQLYKLKHERIGGVVIETGETLPVPEERVTEKHAATQNDPRGSGTVPSSGRNAAPVSESGNSPKPI